jgi:hypothetical protein
MKGDRAPNNLSDARNWRRLKSRRKKFNDFLGKEDLDDLIKFNLKASSSVKLVAKRNRENIDLELFEIDGKARRTLQQIGDTAFSDLKKREIRQSLNRLGRSKRNGSKREKIRTELDKGTYYIRVSYAERQGDGTKYRLIGKARELPQQLTDTVGNTPADARSILFDNGSFTTEESISAGDLDYYNFSVTNRQKVQINLTDLAADAGLQILASDGTTVIKESANSGTVAETINRLLDAGTYFIKVDSKDGNETTYTLSVKQTALTQTFLFNGSGLPDDQGFFEYGQYPISYEQAAEALNTSVSALQNLIPSSLEFLFDDEAPQTPGANGVTIDTRLSTTNENSGYVGYSNYEPDLSSINLLSLALNPPSNLADLDIDINLVNPSFPVLDSSAGYSLEFNVALNSESSNPNRAGFNLILIDQAQQGIELGFKGDRIFAQSTTFQEAESASFTTSTSTPTSFKLDVQDNGYQLFANNSLLLEGALRQYSFDPAMSDPPLPLNPYTTPNFLFLGDNTDQGHATFTLGGVSLFT